MKKYSKEHLEQKLEEGHHPLIFSWAITLENKSRKPLHGKIRKEDIQEHYIYLLLLKKKRSSISIG